AAVNLALGLGGQSRRTTGEWELALQLAFNLLQASGLLFLAGGVLNPLSVMLIAPVSLAAATLKPRYAVILGVLAATCAFVLALRGSPLPWPEGMHPKLSPLYYRLLVAGGITVGITLIGGYSWRAAADAARMELALGLTQTVLAREQRLSALGG